jgi:hypothetical protein
VAQLCCCATLEGLTIIMQKHLKNQLEYELHVRPSISGITTVNH